MRRIFASIVAYALLASAGHAASTINPNVPANASALTSSVVRGNFAAAYNDVNNLTTLYAGSSAPGAPSVGQYWRKTDVSPQRVYQWTGSAWVQVSTFNTTTGAITPYFGSALLAWQQLLTGTGGLGTTGQCITSTGPTTVPQAQNCVSGASFQATQPLAWNAGTLTVSLNYDSNFTVSGGNLALATSLSFSGKTITGGTHTATSITSSTINSTAIGGTTPAAGAFTTGDFSGAITGSANISLGGANTFQFTARTAMQSPADGQLTLISNGGSAFGRINLGGATSSFPAIKRNAAALNFRLGDDSADAAITAAGGTFSAATSIAGLTVTGSLTATGLVTNAALANPSTTVNGQVCTLGSSCTISASAGTITVGTTTVASATANAILYNNAGTLGGITTGNDGVLITSGAGVPSISSTIPSATQNNITRTGTLVAGSTGAGFTVALATSTISGALPAANMPALTGDISSSAGTVATTLATVNANVGSFGGASSVPNFTVNGKGLITAAGATTVVAPAGTLTGTTLNSTVVTSSLTSVGTLTGGATGAGFTINFGTSTVSGTVPIANLPVGTAAAKGILQGDGSTLTITTGTVACTTATGAQIGCARPDGSTITITSGVLTAIGGAATSVQIGTTTVTSGTSTRVIYNNAGVLGEYAVSGSGSVCMTTSCVHVTPVLGTPTSGNMVNTTGYLVSNLGGLGTGIATALAVNTGTAGAPAILIASGAKALATSAIASGACSSAQTDTATGAATTDAAIVAFASDPTAVTGYAPVTTGMLAIVYYATTNTMNFKVCNTTGASITPGAITINWRIVR